MVQMALIMRDKVLLRTEATMATEQMTTPKMLDKEKAPPMRRKAWERSLSVPTK
ncbi:hypothetical protein D3C86_2060240 [compost metagenome]